MSVMCRCCGENIFVIIVMKFRVFFSVNGCFFRDEFIISSIWVNFFCPPPVSNHETFFFGPGLDLKLHPGVRSSRNSMKVLTARTDVSYLRDYKTGGEEGYAGRFCAFRVFLFFSNPASPISPVHSLCLSVGVCGTSPSPQGLNAPALFYASSPWQGI